MAQTMPTQAAPSVWPCASAVTPPVSLLAARVWRFASIVGRATGQRCPLGAGIHTRGNEDEGMLPSSAEALCDMLMGDAGHSLPNRRSRSPAIWPAQWRQDRR